MRILVAPDSFKECITAKEAAAAIAVGLRRAGPSVQVEQVPLGDGGEGTAACLREALGCAEVAAEVSGPLLSPLRSHYDYDPVQRRALIESAAACGLALVPREQRDPLRTSSRGVGELILAALSRGAQRIVVGVGGTASVDFGTGMAAALGYEFLDRDGNALAPGGGALLNLETIRPPRSRVWEGVRMVAACDVSNPLLGERGAARVFGPQKGAREPESVMRLEAGLQRVQEILERQLATRVGDEAGAGAGGGLGAGLLGFLGAELVSGSRFVMDCLGVEERVRRSDLVITGEGSTDRQTAEGKICSGVCSLAKKHGVPCIILAGRVVEPVDALRHLGATEIIGINPPGEELAESFSRVAPRLSDAAAGVAVRYVGRNQQ